MPQPESNSRIEQLKKSLYSRTTPDVRTRRKLRYTDEVTDVKTNWESLKDDNIQTPLNNQYENHSMSFFTKLFIVSIIFCIMAVGAGAYLFFNGANLISADNIDIKISGPVSVSGGEPVSFDIVAMNKNNVDLQMVDMTVDFPDGSVDPVNTTQSLKTYTKLIGDIKSGGNAKENVKAIIFGEENNQKEITVKLTYSIKGSSSIFTKTQTYGVLISSAPINVTLSAFDNVTSGQEFDIKATLKSNSKEVLKNIVLKAQYPFGFTYISSSVTPYEDKSTWKIGDIPQGSERTITIHGKLTGEDNDSRIFHFTVGTWNPNDQRTIATQYLAVEQLMKIEKPFISLKISVDSDQSSDAYVGNYNQSERVYVQWFNNLPDPVSNVAIKVKLSGTAYSKNSVSPDSGYFNSGTDEVVWSSQTNPGLASVGAGESGTVSFSLIPIAQDTNSKPIINPAIDLSAVVSGRRIQETNVPQMVDSAATKSIHISSNVTLSGRVVRTVGPFANTGFIPPKLDTPTTYTVIWDVDNTSNAVNNAVIKAKLPPYVKWLKAVSPDLSDVTYDENTGIVTWNIGNVETFTLNSTRRKEVAFQISFTPNVNQVEQIPTLVERGSLTAKDNFTGADLESNQEVLTTRYSTDPSYKQGFEKVTK